jgi:hypothetical protein
VEVTVSEGDVGSHELFVIGESSDPTAPDFYANESRGGFAGPGPRPMPPLDTPRNGVAVAACCGYIPIRLFAFGGESAEGVSAQTEEYHPAVDRWDPRDSMPTARRDPGAAVVGEAIYVIGGMTADGSVTGANEAFTP